LSSRTNWIAVDWGTSNLRAWGIGYDGAVTFVSTSDKGMGRLTPDGYPAALSEVLAGHYEGASGDVLISGMAGARQGWMEAPYLDAPADLRGLVEGAISPPMPSGGLRVRILPGVCQKAPGSENVMRGEETQLLGLSRIVPGYAGPVCMPGTHSKWALVEGARLASFTTAMTGELYELLRQYSLLRQSLEGETEGPKRAEGFRAGLDMGIAKPQDLTSRLFTLRAASLLSGRGADWCDGYLSGLLIGAEVGARKELIGTGDIPVIGSPMLSMLYAEAIERLGGKARIIDAADATLAGLRAAREFSS